MSTALELKLKPGERILVARGIWERNPSCMKHKGCSFWRAPEAEVLEVDEKSTKIRYENGGEKSIALQFIGLARNRNWVQRMFAPVYYFLKKYTTI